MPDLTFGELRRANELRLPLFVNGQGGAAHASADGTDWSPAEWAMALTGELGELCNKLKKVRRGDLTQMEAHFELRREIADVMIYLDLLAKRLDIDLGDAVVATFNAKSLQLGIPVRFFHNGALYESAHFQGE